VRTLLFADWSSRGGADTHAEFEATAFVHARSLLRFALSLVRDRHHAEDLVQETLMKAWRSFHQFEPGTNCRAWLFRILVNARNREFSKRRTLVEVVNIDDVELPIRESASASTEIRSAFDNLSPEHREVLTLGVVEGFTLRELSETLEMPVGTVMSRLSRARARLRELLTPGRTTAVPQPADSASFAKRA
jgi:RNA polymerase sigma-70 factor (ECF subfamily)